MNPAELNPPELNPTELRFRETQEWLAKAAADLASAQLLAGARHDANALYHCQQCSEKALKAFLVWHEQPFRRTHDLEEIGVACAVLDASLQGIAEEADRLTDYAWRARYPGNPFSTSPEEVALMLGLAGRVLGAVKSRIPLAAPIAE